MRLKMANVHERRLAVSAAEAGRLLDALATAGEKLWPGSDWPPMRFAGGLRVGAVGGHGPIRYRVLEVVPGSRVRFEFLAPNGLRGEHGFYVIGDGGGGCVLRHAVLGDRSLAMRLLWPLLWGPLHDALIEEALERAHQSLSHSPPPDPPRRSFYVRLLRGVLGRTRRPRGGRSSKSTTPDAPWDPIRLPSGIKGVRTVRRQGRRPRQQAENLIAHRCYDHAKYRRELWARGVKPVIARRNNTQHGSGLGKLRWVVERTFAWLHFFRRLRLRWERRPELHKAFLHLGCAIICQRYLRASQLS